MVAFRLDKNLGRYADGEGVGTPLSPTTLGSGSDFGMAANNRGLSATDAARYLGRRDGNSFSGSGSTSSVNDSLGFRSADDGRIVPEPLSVPKPRPEPKPTSPVPKPVDPTPTPTSVPFPQSLARLAQSSEYLVYGIIGEDGVTNRIVEVQNVLIDVRDSIDTLVASFLDPLKKIAGMSEAIYKDGIGAGKSTVGNDPLVQALESIRASLDASSSPTFNVPSAPAPVVNVTVPSSPVPAVNVHVDAPVSVPALDLRPVGDSITKLSDSLPDAETINEMNELKIDALEYDKNALDLAPIAGAPLASVSPRYARVAKDVAVEIKTYEINNERYSDDDFGFGGLSIFGLPYKGVSSALISLQSALESGSSLPTFSGFSVEDLYSNLSILED